MIRNHFENTRRSDAENVDDGNREAYEDEANCNAGLL